MTDAMRRKAALRLRELLDKEVPRKQAILQVRTELRAKGLPSSKSQLYAWCKKWGVSTR